MDPSDEPDVPLLEQEKNINLFDNNEVSQQQQQPNILQHTDPLTFPEKLENFQESLKSKQDIPSRLSAVEADGCQVSRPLRGLHDFTPTACVRSMRTWGGAWHVDLDVGKERRPRAAWRGSGRRMAA